MDPASVNLSNRVNPKYIMKSSILQIHPADTILVALKNLTAGQKNLA